MPEDQPASDMTSTREGLGLKYAVDRSKSLSRTGSACASLLSDVALLHDELARSILKSIPLTLDAVSQSTPLTMVAGDAAACVVSFAKQTQGLAICIRNDVARPWTASAASLGDAAPGIYGRYATSRRKCDSARREAWRARHPYVRCVKEADIVIRALRKGADRKGAAARHGSTSSSNGGDGAIATGAANSEWTSQQPQAADTAASGTVEGSPPSSSPPEPSSDATVPGLGWEDAVRAFGEKRGVAKHSDAVVRALGEVQVLEGQYAAAVRAENAAVSGAQAMERMGLEAVQELEEERILFFLESLGRLLQAEKGALDNMTLDLQVESLDLKTYDGYYNDQSTASSPSASTLTPAPSSIFMSPRRRTATDDEGPAIVETRALHLSDDMAESRDSMKSMLTRQSARLQALKLVYRFHEEVVGATNSFAVALHTKLASEGYARKIGTTSKSPLVTAINKVEGTRVRSSWNTVMTSLESCAQRASTVAKKVKEENVILLKLYASAERELKANKENEDIRWKFVCDAARGEVKARARHEQCLLDLEKARDRLSGMEDDATVDTNTTASESTVSDDSTAAKEGEAAVKTTLSPFRTKKTIMSSSVKMEQNMNKAMGRMFSILPGGGEDVMAKVLKPEQRLAIAKRSLDDLVTKETRETKSLEAAGSVRQQAISTYQSEVAAVEESFDEDEVRVWTVLQKSLQGSVAAIGNFRDGRREDIWPAMDALEGRSILVADMTDWTAECEASVEKVVSKKKVVIGGSGVGAGFALKCVLESSSDVEGLVLLVLEDGKQNEHERLEEGSQEGCQEGSQEVSHEGSKSESDAKSESEYDSSDEAPMDEPASPTSLTSSTPPPAAKPNDSSSISSSSPTADSDVVQIFKSFADAFLPTPSKPDAASTEAVAPAATATSDQDAAGGAVSQNTTTTNSETEVFLTHFWEHDSESGGGEEHANPPTVIQSFSCAYWPKEGEGYISPLLHGRMFVTSPAMYFIGWGEHKIKLDWEDVVSVTKESTMMGTIDNAIRITFDSNGKVSAYFFGSFAYREHAFQLINKMVTIAASLKKIKGNNTVEEEESSKQESKTTLSRSPVPSPKKAFVPVPLPPVPEDATVKKMESIFSNKLKNVTIEKYYNVGWSEGNGTDAAPLYGPWLNVKGSFDISLTDWETSEAGFEHPWSKEVFSQRRIVKFRFKRTSHLYIGPPIAGVTQTQYCLRDGNDKCIVMMTVEMDGIPYSDSFAVEVRWAARRVGAKDIVIDSGVFVRMIKSNMFAGKIRSGTYTETKPIHDDLFETIKSALASAKESSSEVNEDSEEDVDEDVRVDEDAEEDIADKKVMEETAEKKGGELSVDEHLEAGGTWSIVSSQIEIIVGQAQNDKALFAGGLVVLLIVVLRILFSFFAHTDSPSSGQEVDVLVGKIDELSNEVREMKILLEQALLLMSKANAKNEDII